MGICGTHVGPGEKEPRFTADRDPVNAKRYFFSWGEGPIIHSDLRRTARIYGNRLKIPESRSRTAMGIDGPKA